MQHSYFQKLKIISLKVINQSMKSKSQSKLPNKLMHTNVLYNNELAIANGFDKYFVEIPKILLSNINMHI